MDNISAFSAETYTIPGWFAKLFSFILVLVVPWSAWMTLMSYSTSIKVESLAASQPTITSLLDRCARLEERVNHLEQKVPSKVGP